MMAFLFGRKWQFEDNKFVCLFGLDEIGKMKLDRVKKVEELGLKM